MQASKQKTVRDRVEVRGHGVHSGSSATIAILPAAADHGIAFLRGSPVNGRVSAISATHERVTPSELCTMIGDETSGSVATIEHILSALHGLGIDNALIEIDGPEVPIVDGSAWPFVEAIESVGVVELQRSRRVLKVLKHVRVDIGSAFAELRPSASGFSLDVEIDFASPVIGRQRWAMNLNPECYRRDVAKARTFGFMKDVQRLWQAGYARGANLDNTVAVDEDRVVNPGGLRFRDEFVRHKLLDAVGDLALAGRSIVGAFRSYCSGHRLNIMVLQALFADRHAYELIDSPHYSGRPQASHDALLPQAAYAPERF